MPKSNIFEFIWSEFLPYSLHGTDSFFERKNHVRIYVSNNRGNWKITDYYITYNLLFLDNFSLFSEELCLTIYIFTFNPIIEFISALMTSVNSLNKASCTDSTLEVPLYFQHAPVLLNIDHGTGFLVSLLFSFTIDKKVNLIALLSNHKNEILLQPFVEWVDNVCVPLRLLSFVLGHVL